jgi:hypothetical protein
MFEAMGVNAPAAAWEPACIAFLAEGFGTPDVVGMVVDAPDGGGLAASGVIELTRTIPSPRSPHGTSTPPRRAARSMNALVSWSGPGTRRCAWRSHPPREHVATAH